MANICLQRYLLQKARNVEFCKFGDFFTLIYYQFIKRFYHIFDLILSKYENVNGHSFLKPVNPKTFSNKYLPLLPLLPIFFHFKANPFHSNYKATVLLLPTLPCTSNHIDILAQFCKNGYVKKMRRNNVEIYFLF